MVHVEKVEFAKLGIQRVAEDATVPAAERVKSLQELRAMIERYLGEVQDPTPFTAFLRNDFRNNPSGGRR